MSLLHKSFFFASVKCHIVVSLKVRAKHNELHKIYLETQQKLLEVQKQSADIDHEMEKLSEIEQGENQR